MPLSFALALGAFLALAASAVAQEVPGWESAPSFGRIVLHAGFEHDPRVLDVDAAGGVDSPLDGEGCTGYVGDSPDHVVEYIHYDWAPDFGAMLTFSATSGLNGDDLSLIVRTPSGAYHCDDDTTDLDPRIDVANEPGEYRIWVGNAVLAEYESIGYVGVSENGTVVQ